MHIAESVSSRCRYGSHAVEAFKGAEVVWEEAEDDYQGFAALIFRLPDGRYGFYEWYYGSCSGCDDWEARDLSGDEIVAEMQNKGVVFATSDELLAWLGMTTATGAIHRPAQSVIEPLLRTPAPSSSSE